MCVFVHVAIFPLILVIRFILVDIPWQNTSCCWS